MATSAGVDIPREKRVEVALTYIYAGKDPCTQPNPRRYRRQPDTASGTSTDQGARGPS